MSERLSMMPGYCTEHDLRFDRLGCPICVMDKFDDPRPTLSPEAQAVLEAAMDIERSASLDATLKTVSPYMRQKMNRLVETTRAWQATQKPKDYAPDELEPGQRFRFAEIVGSNPERSGGEVVDVSNHAAGRGDLWRRMWKSNDGKVFAFHRDDRLIPLPEQDG